MISTSSGTLSILFHSNVYVIIMSQLYSASGSGEWLPKCKTKEPGLDMFLLPNSVSLFKS